MCPAFYLAGGAEQGVLGGPGPPNILEKNIHKSQKKGTLKFSSHYLGPLNNYRVAHTLYIGVIEEKTTF